MIKTNSSTAGKMLLLEISRAFPDIERNETSCTYLVEFPAKFSKIGTVSIVDYGDEFLLYIGNITHIHFFADENKGVEQDSDLVLQVMNFLNKLFLDKIEFYGYGFAGGCRERSVQKRNILSKLFLGWKTYVWSGSID